ncbi:hypothetical protein LTS03_002281 [Exophiala xenobiotica]|nr:hypothetical protein LTR92_001755 [Exophiala xenobiotica]KAK5249255.1 hypothetical protein LTS06_005764 [Exophiala xenobiotica]KAK5326450.1 hypothetical protein LTR93_003312 [Exophiala xenobiotica]KAK5353139.1 hypothetical protein LTR61_003096 [Exophiala xenobiotica]KAK5379920.1 hypothetical protein LTR11_003548 [Exophiala xenobiotica]
MSPPHGPKPQVPATFPGPLQVIAAGLPRCATSTLKEVFEDHLAIGPCMHMNRCLPHPATMKLVHDALREPDTPKRRAILYTLFDGYAATADFPGHLFIEDLIDMYPDAKVVLNVRKGGATDWEASMKTTIAPFMSWQYRVACWWSVPDWWHYQTEMAWEDDVKKRFGVDHFWDAAAYDAHNDWVKRLCQERGRDVLVWEPGMGWDGLCEFVDRKEPTVPLPRNNDRAKMEKVVQWRIALGLRLWAKRAGLTIALSVVGSWGLGRMLSIV